MGKRSTFERRERDFYATPESAVLPLLPWLPRDVKFAEPCAGDGALIDTLERHGAQCVQAHDIEPQTHRATRLDALEMICAPSVQQIITNPPWRRDLLHPMIYAWAVQRPTWLLFDADWMHTRQASELMLICHRVVSVGRVKWIEGSKHTGKDNCAWYLFDAIAPRQCDGALLVGR